MASLIIFVENEGKNKQEWIARVLSYWKEIRQLNGLQPLPLCYACPLYCGRSLLDQMPSPSPSAYLEVN